MSIEIADLVAPRQRLGTRNLAPNIEAVVAPALYRRQRYAPLMDLGWQANIPDAPAERGVSSVMRQFLDLRKEVKDGGETYARMKTTLYWIRDSVAQNVIDSTPSYFFDGGSFDANRNVAIAAKGGIQWHIDHIESLLTAKEVEPDAKYSRAVDAWNRMQEAVLALAAMKEGEKAMARAWRLLKDDLEKGIKGGWLGVVPWWAWAGGGVAVLVVFAPTINKLVASRGQRP